LFRNLYGMKSNNLLCPSAIHCTCRCIDDVLLINHAFHIYVHSIYPDELEIKDATESDIAALYLDSLLNMDSNGKLSRSGCIFAIIKCPFLCSNTPLSPAYVLNISQLIGYHKSILCDSKQGQILTNKFMLEGYKESRLCHHSHILRSI
jgi:hypothetical protein